MENTIYPPVPTRTQGVRKTSKEMFPLVEKWLESGERQQDFCHHYGLKPSLFAYWLKKYRSQKDRTGESSGKFVALTVSPDRSRVEIEIHYPNGVSIRAGVTAGARFLRELAGQC